ncbi:MAG: terminase gpP N-terminus-related DNA-binding protein [Bacteroidales bacterium]
MTKKQVRRATPAEKSHAEMLYCERKWTIEAIAETLERDPKTITAWRDQAKWDETKNLFDTGPTQFKKLLLSEAVRITKGEERKDEEGNLIKPIDADSLSKIMKAYDYMSQKASPATCRDVFMEFDNWLSMIDPKIAAKMTKHHKGFLIYKIGQENGN